MESRGSGDSYQDLHVEMNPHTNPRAEAIEMDPIIGMVKPESKKSSSPLLPVSPLTTSPMESQAEKVSVQISDGLVCIP